MRFKRELLPNAARVEHTDDTPPTSGACAATEAEECAAGNFSNRSDRPLENGACGSTTDRCSDGTFSNRSDTTSEHRWACLGVDGAKLWRCLGTNGSKNWNCASGTELEQCSVADPAASDSCSETTEATDASCSSCNEGYHRHNGQCVQDPDCGSSENSCRRGTVEDTGDTPPTSGACAATEAEECAAGNFSNRSDRPLENGACGSTTDRCSDGTFSNRSDTTSEHRWACLGVDGAKLWRCLGTNGSKNWNCASGTELEQCSVADPAASDSCSETTEATDASCSSCNEGYHRHNGQCVQDPDCGSSENSCRRGTVEDTGDTPPTSGACAATEAEECAAGNFSNRSDRPHENGACGSTTDRCSDGTFSNRSDTTSEHRWACLGVDGAKLWRCLGTNGSKNWNCASGTELEQCSVADPAASDSCSEATEATDASCSSCKEGYHRHNGQCVQDPVCGSVTCVGGACDSSGDDNGSCTVGTFSDVADTGVDFKWQCTSGNMTASCSHQIPDPPDCSPSSVYWTVGNRTCEASLPRTEHSDEVTVTDSTINSNNPYTGSATFSCSRGDWSSETNASCGCGDECLCMVAGNTWMEAQPERSRTCTGNDACTPGSHTHSCTTPADPNGGYSSCEYSRHRGGIYCASHRTETCNPIPAVPAHCHVESGGCDFCCEFGDDTYCP